MACRSSFFRPFFRFLAFFQLAVFFFFPETCHAFDHHEWDKLVGTHVKNGLVQYTSFQNHQAELERYLESVARYPLELLAEEPREERMALWMNVFNASVIQSVLRHYPVNSTGQIPNFWDEKNIQVSGMFYSLRDIKEQIFRGSFRDERALLALTAGEMTSPPLRNEAYSGAVLMDQLADQMNLFLTDERHNKIKTKSKKLQLSHLFKEYEADFVLGYGRSEETGKFSPQQFAALNFIKIHLKDPELQNWIVQSKYKVSYLKRDSRLNEAAEDPENGQ